MNYRIETLNSFVLFGKGIHLKPDANLYELLLAFGDEIFQNGTHDRINDAAGRPHGSLLHGAHYGFGEDGSRNYMYCLEKPEGDIPEEFTLLEVSGSNWAVFEETGSMPDQIAIQNIWKRVYSEWFPTSGYEQSPGPCLEKYIWLDSEHIKYRCEVWIPIAVLKKQK